MDEVTKEIAKAEERAKTFLGHRQGESEEVRAASGVMTNTSSICNEAEEFNIRAAEGTFGAFQDDVMGMQTLENDLEAGHEFRFRSCEDNDVVNEDVANDAHQALEHNFSHGSLKPGRGVSEAERHAEEPILAKRGYESRPIASVVCETKLMIARPKIHAACKVACKVGEDRRCVGEGISHFSGG